MKLLPRRLRELEAMTPAIQRDFRPNDRPRHAGHGPKKYRVALLTGCAQDMIFSEVNRDTAEVLARNGCEVVTPAEQSCCGSLHAHNGEWELARRTGTANRLTNFRRNNSTPSSATPPVAVRISSITRSCSPRPALPRPRRQWDRKLKDIHEWLAKIGHHARRPARRAAANGDLPRSLSSLPRPENHRATPAGPERDPEFEAGGTAGKHLVLRQRGHLQSHPARNGQRTAGTQTQAHRKPARASWPRPIPAAFCKSSRVRANGGWSCAWRIRLRCWPRPIARAADARRSPTRALPAPAGLLYWRFMSLPGYHVRRAIVDDLQPLRGLWEHMHLSSPGWKNG